MPSLDDGPSICLSGNAKTPGSEHNAAHEGTDPRIAAAGDRSDNGLKGLARMGEILDISVEEVAKVKPHCAEEIQRKTAEAFRNVDRDQYGRTTQQPPKKGTEAQGALERGDRHGSTPMGLFYYDPAQPQQGIRKLTTTLQPDVQDANLVEAVEGVLWPIGPKDIVRHTEKGWERRAHPDNPPIR